jgi:hypothetical protein
VPGKSEFGKRWAQARSESSGNSGGGAGQLELRWTQI